MAKDRHFSFEINRNAETDTTSEDSKTGYR